ncbi:MAG: zinc-dependent alcohol dehydrogenase [Carbonactinosporaceae bacterium]
MTTCRVVVNVAPGRCEVEKIGLPAELAGGALGEVLAAGVCGSDLAAYTDASFTARPLILGHENVVRLVEVEALAGSRWDVSVGDRVAVEEFVPCGHCDLCRGGSHRLCPRTDYTRAGYLRYGRTPLTVSPGLWGGFGEFLFAHPDAALHKIPPAVPDELAPLFVPLANGLRWVTGAAGVRPGESVVVVGPGSHGLGCVIAALESGAGPVIVVGLRHDARRLEVARLLGAHATVRADDDDAAATVRDLTGGRMADAVLDVTAGAPEALQAAVDLAAVGGRVVVAGGRGGQEARLLPDQVLRKELRILGVRGHDSASIRAALDLLAAGRYPLDEVTVSYPLVRTEKAFRDLSEGGEERPIHATVAPRQ